MVSQRAILAVVLSALMLVSAGCTGWGEDGPADPEEESDGNGEAQEEVDPADDDEDSGESPDDSDESEESADTDESDESDSEAADTDTDTDSSTGVDESDESDDTDDSDEADESDDEGNGNGDSDDDEASSNGDDNDDEDPEMNTLTVEVEDINNDPVEGAEVHVSGANGDPDDARDLQYEGTTNSEGIAEIEVQAAANYVVTVEADDYETASTETSLDREAFIVLEPELTEHTVIVENEEGEGIEGAEVDFIELNTTIETDSDGEITTMFDARYDSRNHAIGGVSHPDYKDHSGQNLDPVDGGETVIELEPEPEEVTTDVVVEDEEGEPLEGATVITYDGDERETTDDNGWVSITMTEGEELTVDVTHSDYTPRYGVTIVGGEQNNITMTDMEPEEENNNRTDFLIVAI